MNGRVTLDGTPLKGAAVGFYPEQGRGSHGETDADGRYDLKYTNQKAGVPAGKCVVRITTADANTLERLPARYHEESKVVEDVKPGSNVFNFDLKSK
ncbi:MAG: carboxypeptidase regulatory-like domain-containing protein [Gemmataceae bacterium]